MVYWWWNSNTGSHLDHVVDITFFRITEQQCFAPLIWTDHWNLMLEHLQRIIWPTPLPHCFCKLLGIYLDLVNVRGQQLVSSTSLGSNPISIIWVYLLLQALCQNIDAALSLQVDDYYSLALSKWVAEKNLLLWEFILFPLSFHRNKSVSSILFSLLSISEECLPKDCSWDSLFYFHDGTWSVSLWIGLC